MMNKTQVDDIIDDLLLKRPMGPAGNSVTYIEKEKYDYNRGGYRVYQIPDDPCYGYTPQTLFSLGFKTESSVRSYVQNRWFGGMSNWQLGRKKSTVTRRTRRIWDRISAAVSDVARTGGKGIYQISSRYGSTGAMGYVYASNPAEAESMAETFFVKERKGDEWKIKFVELGTVEKLNRYNEKVRQRCQEKVKASLAQIEQLKVGIGSLEHRMTMLTVLGGHQLAVESEVGTDGKL